MSLLLETENWKVRVGHLQSAEARESHQRSRTLDTSAHDRDGGGCNFQLTYGIPNLSRR